jgi:hypothetical protein
MPAVFFPKVENRYSGVYVLQACVCGWSSALLQLRAGSNCGWWLMWALRTAVSRQRASWQKRCGPISCLLFVPADAVHLLSFVIMAHAFLLSKK